MDLQSGMTGRDLRVPVINMHNEPLIPCVKSTIEKGEEKKLDINTKKVKLVKYGKRLRFTAQFLPPLKKVGILGGVR